MDSSTLADLIESNADDLLRRWTAQADAKLAPGKPSESGLRNHIPLVLRDLVRALRQDRTPQESGAGQEHGGQRHRLGFDLDALVHEYGLLRELILDLAEERGTAVSLQEVRTLTGFFASAVAEGVTAFTRQKRDLQARLQVQEASLATTLSSIGDAVIASDLNGRITFLNPVAQELTGWSREDARGALLADVFRIINEHDRTTVQSPVERVLAEGTVQGLANHTLLLRKDGSEVPIDDSAAPIRDEQGAMTGVVLVFRDVTEKKQAEAVLANARDEAERERQKLTSLFMQAPVGICMLEGPRHVFTFANPRYRELLNGRDIVGKPLLEALPDVRNDGFDKLMDRVVATGEAFVGKEVAVKLDHHEGDQRLIVNFVYQPKRNAAGEIDGILAVVTDVTEQVQARQKIEALAAALAQSEEYLRLVIESSGAATFSLELESGAMVADARYRELAGLTADEPVTRERRLAIIHPEDSPRVAERLREAASGTTGGRYQVDYRTHVLPDGGRRWVQSTGKVKGGKIFGINVDITPQKRAEEDRERLLASVESERQKLRSFFLNAPAFLALLRGPTHVIELFNEPYQRLVGVGRKLVGLTVADALPEVVPQGFIGLLDAVYSTGKPFISAETAVRLDRRGTGELEDAYVNFVYEAVRTADGAIEGIVVFGFDITQHVLARHQLEQLAGKLRQSEERLRLVVTSSGTGTFSMDTVTGQIEADERFRELFGFTPGQPFSLEKGLATIHPEDSPRVSKAVADAIAGINDGNYAAEYRTPSKSGGHRWVEARGKVVFAADGKPAQMFGTGLDITARKQVEQARTRLLESLASQSVFGVAVLRGPTLIFEMANDVYRKIAGDRDLIGLPFLEALPELAGQGADTQMREVLRSGKAFTAEEYGYRMLQHGGGVLPEQRYFSFTWQPVLTPDGLADTLLILTHDVTEAVRARERESKQAEEAKRRSLFDQQILGIVSHDLRNPLAAIVYSAATLARRESLDERSRKSAARIQSSAERAGRMVNDLLDFTQARLGGGIRVTRKEADLAEITRTVLAELEAAQQTRKLTLQVSGGVLGVWDFDRLTQVVQNLLTNAISYSPEDSEVRVEIRGVGQEVRLSVHNSGAPIAPEMLDRLFEPMQRGSSSSDLTRSVGLGLYIVKAVVDAHQGRVEVQSSAEAGTTFTVHLPRSIA